MNPTLLQIKVFVAVYEERSFTMAAMREGLVQSGVSQHMRQLEELLGVQLFNRQRGVEPTPAGDAYYSRCIQLLRAHAEACGSLESFADDLGGTLRIGLIPTLTRSVFSQALIAFEAQHPHVSIQLTEAYASVVTDAVRYGRLDFAIVPRGLHEQQGLRSTLFAVTPAFLLSAPDSGLSHGEPVRLADLAALSIVLPAPHNARRATLEDYLAEQGAKVASRLVFESMLGTMDLVRSSHWVTVMPGLFISDDLPKRRFTLNPLTNPTLWEELVLIELERQPLSTAAQAFVKMLRICTDEANTLPMRLAHGESLADILPTSTGAFEPPRQGPTHFALGSAA